MTKISFVYERAIDDDPRFVGPERYDLFVAELAKRLGTGVPMLLGPLASYLPLEGFVILCAARHPRFTLEDLPPDVRPEIARRIVAIDISSVRILEYLESAGIAGAIDSLSFTEWNENTLEQRAHGLYASPEVGARVNANCVALATMRSANYCYLESTCHFGVPHLLADYLVALEHTTPT